MTKVAGILLAAGASSRMGRPKQMLDLGGRSLLDRVLEQTLCSDLDHVTLVLGHRAREIKKGLKTDLRHPKLRIIINRHYRKGMSTSLIAGLSGVEDAYDHVMIILADMPCVTSGLINHLIRAYAASGRLLGAVTARNRRSHPVIFSRRIFPELHGLKGDNGAKDLFLRHPDDVFLLEPEGFYEDRDIDTPADYQDMVHILDKNTDRLY
ncbi:MAG: nucleotidyltransferase family protein [Pseudomonadota bacterium]